MLRIVKINDVTFMVEEGEYKEYWDRFETNKDSSLLETFSLIDNVLNIGSTFVDIGAWIGTLSLYAAAKQAKVVTYECDPVALDNLSQNIAANPKLSPRIYTIALALTDTTREQALYSDAFGNSESSIYSECPSKTTKQKTVIQTMDVLSAFNINKFHQNQKCLIRIDVNGCEFEIIPRLRSLISNSQCMWYISFNCSKINPFGFNSEILQSTALINAIMHFKDLDWYNPSLNPVNKPELINNIFNNKTLPSSLIFSPVNKRMTVVT